jgi:hypothetical protein
MDGRMTLLVLAYLLQKMGSPISVGDAVYCLSFEYRYGAPSAIRSMLTAALQNGMISRRDDMVEAAFLYEKQIFDLQAANRLMGAIGADRKYQPMY